MTIEPSTIGIIGVGTMGSRIAEALRPHHRLVVWDIDEAAAERQRSAGATVLASPAEVADHVEVALLSLPGPQQVRQVVTGADGLLAPSQPPRVIADLSTVDPNTTREMAAVAADCAVDYLDAPVLGRPHRCGAWTLPVGGPQETIDGVRPILDKLASRIVRVGSHGDGNIVKLLNNMMFGAINAITAETMAAAVRLGLDPEIYYATLADSGAASVSNLFKEIAPKIATHDWTPAFTIDLLVKDNRLALSMMKEAGLEARVASAVSSFNEAGQAAGLGPLDTSALVQLLQQP